VTFCFFFLLDIQNLPGYEFIPMMLFGIGGLVAGTILWLLPETKDKPTLQTIDEANIFYVKHFQNLFK